MEAGIDPCSAGDRRALAPGGVQAVLDVALAASDPPQKKMREPGIARTHLPHGCREPHLGRAPHSRRTEDARIRYFGANCAPLDAQGVSKSRTCEAMDVVSEQSSRSNCCDGFLHRADAHLRSPLLLFYHCP